MHVADDGAATTAATGAVNETPRARLNDGAAPARVPKRFRAGGVAAATTMASGATTEASGSAGDAAAPSPLVMPDPSSKRGGVVAPPLLREAEPAC